MADINKNQNKMIKNNYYIITGGPGAGKTTLINELERSGYKYVPEVARKIIKHQLEVNGDALPWADTKDYSRLMLEYCIRDYNQYIQNDEILFFDRGIPDTLGYESLMNFQENNKLQEAVTNYRYNEHVFILPPHEGIYTTDNERKQSFEEAAQTYKVMMSVYKKLSYNLIIVPFMPPILRAEFVINHIQKNRNLAI